MIDAHKSWKHNLDLFEDLRSSVFQVGVLINFEANVEVDEVDS